MTWDGPAARWWQGEVAGDPAYERDVDPLLRSLLPEAAEGPVLDLGCGDGRLLRDDIIGFDRSRALARVAAGRGVVGVADVTDLPLETGAACGAYAVLVLEHLPDAGAFFREVARVVAEGGWLVVIVNHPFWTAPGSGPFLDPADGEVLWRWGGYLGEGFTDEPAGDGSVRFHHRSFGDLLGVAAGTGWALDRLIERAIDPGDDPLLALQAGLPRLLGVSWRRVPQQPGVSQE